MGDTSRSDDALFSVLKDCGNLPKFLDAVFGFLSRRTDFYYVAPEKNAPVGMAEGYAEAFVRSAFFRWKEGGSRSQTFEETHFVPEPVQETEIAYCEEVVVSDDCNADETGTAAEECHADVHQQQSPPTPFFTPAECYNGAAYEHYAWSQTIGELGVSVRIPDGVSTKQLDVNVTPLSLSVTLKPSSSRAEQAPIISGQFPFKCKHADVIWSLTATKLDIQLEKVQERWWDCLLLDDEPRIDLQKIDASTPFEDLSDVAQAKIQELQWNQERKRLGLPTTDDLAHEKMRTQMLNARIG